MLIGSLRIGFTAALFLGVAMARVVAAPPPLPVSWQVERLDSALRPEGGAFRLTLLFSRQPNAPAADGLTLTPSFSDGWGRVLWAGQPVAIPAGHEKAPGRLEIAIPHPPLPPGGYMFRGVIRDAAGTELATVRRPIGRVERFDFRRELVWLYWGGGPPTDAMARTLLELGINGHDAPDGRFPYRYFRDHANMTPEARYPEDVVRRPEGTGLEWYRGWVAQGMTMADDGGVVLALLTDETPADFSLPAMRDVRVRVHLKQQTNCRPQVYALYTE